MHDFLDKFYELSKRHRVFYPFFVLVKLVLYLIPLVRHEGLFGAVEWLFKRLKFALKYRHLLNDPSLPEQPIAEFRSRHGFRLTRWIEYVIYDEIFLEGVYEFPLLKESVRQQKEGVVIDWGTHHGLFINFAQSLNPQLEVFGAELSPRTFERAQSRFTDNKKVSLLNAGIAGRTRDVSINLIPISSSQSLYGTQSGETVSVKVITPADFVAHFQLATRKVALLKMDIEGAEKEVFENFDCIKDLLQRTELFVVEIHSPEDVALISGRMESAGFALRNQRDTNYFYSRR
ncbi:MAG: FkbM family methyltransferase [Verrucomicrobiota bacterium]